MLKRYFRSYPAVDFAVGADATGRAGAVRRLRQSSSIRACLPASSQQLQQETATVTNLAQQLQYMVQKHHRRRRGHLAIQSESD